MKSMKRRGPALLLALALALSPSAVLAAGAVQTTPGSAAGLDPSDPAKDSSVSIGVQAFQAALTVYAVDVEWGAMTFWYVTEVWNETTMTAVPNDPRLGWHVYDHEADELVLKLDDDRGINAIKVTNRSNADVKAVFAYNVANGSGVTDGAFTFAQNDKNNFHADFAGNTMTLKTADNHAGDNGAGKATVGTVRFMPETELKTKPARDALPDKANRFMKIGTITVELRPASGGT